MFVYNISNRQETSSLESATCMYDGGQQSSNISLWNNTNISSFSSVPQNGWINPQYIEANGTGLCAFTQSTFTLAFGNGATLTIDLQTANPPAKQISTGNIVCSLSSNFSWNIWTGQVAIGVMILPDPNTVPNQENFTPSDPANWMGNLNEQSGGKFFGQSFSKISLPASHDSGMSCASQCTPMAGTPETQTQTLDIAGQLNAGIRYFDLRPSVWDVNAKNTSEDFAFGHFTSVLGGMGCLGQNMIEALTQVANFIPAHPDEIVILKFSHCGDSHTNSFPTDLQTLMIETIQNTLQNLMYCSTPGHKIGLDTLQTIISSGKRVICIFDGLDTDLHAPANGILIFGDISGTPASDSNFDIYDNYSDSDNLVIMTADQINKYSQFQATQYPEGSAFLLSYTLTQSTNDAILSALGIGSILDLASYANQYLWTVITSLVAEPSQHIPNFIYIDNVNATNAVSAALYLNKQYLNSLVEVEEARQENFV